jgi:chromosome segregation ATPase
MKTIPSNYGLEEKIMAAWGVVEDINLLYKKLCDTQLGEQKDRVENYLLGIKTVYELKFEDLWKEFENGLENNVYTEDMNKQDIVIHKLRSELSDIKIAKNELYLDFKEEMNKYQLEVEEQFAKVSQNNKETHLSLKQAEKDLAKKDVFKEVADTQLKNMKKQNVRIDQLESNLNNTHRANDKLYDEFKTLLAQHQTLTDSKYELQEKYENVVAAGNIVWSELETKKEELALYKKKYEMQSIKVDKQRCRINKLTNS